MNLEQLNDRLKAAKIGVSVRCRGERLSLRATLPPKPGETEAKQRDIALGIYANVAGLKRAEAEAWKLSGQLVCKEFNWHDWIEPEKPRCETVSAWIERFEQDYFERHARNGKSETTWKTDYRFPFNQLPLDEPLTPKLLRDAIVATEPDSRTRKRFSITLGQLARFAGLELDTKSLRGKYSPKRVNPRDLPSDQEISEWRDRIPNEQWQYAFGLMACYGLRNHELWHIDLEKLRDNPVLSLTEDLHGGGKTGARRVWALYPEWWDKWHLWDVSLLPQVTGKTNAALGNRVITAFARYGFHKAYNLRHCWAVRSIDFLPVELAAIQMGHSLTVHTEQYHHWISDEVHQRAYDLAINRSDRPLPP